MFLFNVGTSDLSQTTADTHRPPQTATDPPRTHSRCEMVWLGGALLSAGGFRQKDPTDPPTDTFLVRYGRVGRRTATRGGNLAKSDGEVTMK